MPRIELRDIAGPIGQPTATARDFGAGTGRAISQVGSAIQDVGRISAAWSEQKARRQAAEFRVELEAEYNRLSLSNDLENVGDQFAESRRRLADRYRGGATGVFDREAGIIGDQLSNRFSHHVRQRQILDAQNDLQRTLEIHADAYGRADDPDDRALSYIEGELALDGALANGLIDEIQFDKFENAFQENSVGALASRFLNDDPASGLQYVESAEFPGSEQERQVWRGRFVNEVRRRASSALTEARREEIRINREEKERGIRAQKFLYESATVGRLNPETGAVEIGIRPEDVLAYQNVLTPESFTRLMGIAQGGGRPKATQTDPYVYQMLVESAELGGAGSMADEELESFDTAVFRFWSEGKLTQEDVTRLRTIADDVGVQDPIRRLRDGIGGGLLGGPFRKQKSVEAEQRYIDWYRAYRDRNDGQRPTSDEVDAQVGLLIESAQLVDTSKIPSSQLKPLYAVTGNSGKIDYAATVQRTADFFERGLIDEATYESELEKIERLVGVENPGSEQ